MMTLLGVILLVVGVFPALLYLCGYQKDPFHPLILVGLTSYFIAGHKLLTNPLPALSFMPSSFFEFYLLVTIAAVLSFYFGWYKGGGKKFIRGLGVNESFSPGKLLFYSLVAVVTGVMANLMTYGDWQATGYLRDLLFLWVGGSVVAVQVICFSRNPTYLGLAVLSLAIAAITPIDRFIVYGQRSDIMRTAVVAMVFYLAKQRRPSKMVVVVGASFLLLILATIQLTRGAVNENPTFSARVAAIGEKIPTFFDKEPSYIGGEEHIFGPAAIGAVRESGQYGYGRGYSVYFLQRFAPKEIFPNKWQWFGMHSGYNQAMLSQVMGGTHTIAGGAAPTGFAQAFCELGWASIFIWMLMGYFVRRLWDHAILLASPMAQGLMAITLFLLVLGITQELTSMLVHAIFLLVPLTLCYKFARIHHEYDSYDISTASAAN